MAHIPPVPQAPPPRPQRRRQRPPAAAARPPAAPAAPSVAEQVSTMLDVHFTIGIRDEHVRMTRETYTTFLHIWVAAEETVVLNGDYGNGRYFSMVLRGDEGGTWDVAPAEPARNRPLVEIAPIEVLQNEFLRGHEGTPADAEAAPST